MLQLSIVKLNLVDETISSTHGIQEVNIFVYSYVLQGSNFSGANSLQQLCDPFSERPDKVLSKEPELNV